MGKMEKKEIRRFVFARRKTLTEEEIAAKSEVICQKILALPEFQRADCLYTYMDYNGEVCMRPLIEEAWRLGKKVAAPKVDGETMDYFYIKSYDDLHPGYFQIPEPDAVNPADDEKALLIVPGVGFDSYRNRCGYGKGFYDRFLQDKRQMTVMGLCFSSQIVEEIPHNQYDIRMDKIVTEEILYSFLRI